MCVVQCLRLMFLADFMDLDLQIPFSPTAILNFFLFLIFSQQILKYSTVREALRTKPPFFMVLTFSLVIAILSLLGWLTDICVRMTEVCLAMEGLCQ